MLNIVFFLLVMIIAVLGVIYIILAFDSTFHGERSQNLLFQGCILLIVGLVSAKYFLNSKD